MAQKTYDQKLRAARGISEFKGNFRVQFKLPDVKSAVRKSLGVAACPENLSTAVNILSAIKRDIANGTYRVNPEQFWRTYFPTTSTLETSDIYTVQRLFKLYEEDNYDDLSQSLKSKFVSCRTWAIANKIINIDIRNLTTRDLNRIRKASAKKLAVSTVREYSNTLKRVLDLSIELGVKEFSPFINVAKLDSDDEIGDIVQPFTARELASLLEVIHLPQVKTMVSILAWTGLRPGELKALSWEDVFIDAERKTGYLMVNFNIDRAGHLKPPKTKSSKRKVVLFPETVELLIEQMENTFNLPALNETVYLKHGKNSVVKRRRVFLHNNKPYKRPELTTVSKQWQNWLIEAKIRHRPAYQLRHTYASRMLKLGANHVWLAKQMGHSDWGMIRITYGKWIDECNDNEIEKLMSKIDDMTDE